MTQTLNDAQVAAILELEPWVRARARDQQFALAFGAVMEREQTRRGAPDPVSGAQHRAHLTEGNLLKEEYDLSVHAHSGWTVGVLTCDVRGMIHYNQAHGFPAGDAFLRRTVDALKACFPRARIVRTHVDCFAVLFTPSSELAASEAERTRARDALRALGGPEFTLGLLSLTIENPSHWQVLGPLVWAEAERLHVLERGNPALGILRRTLDLDGRVSP